MDPTKLNLDNLTADQEEFKSALESANIPTDQDTLKEEFQSIADESDLTITNTSPFSPFWCLIKEIVTAPVYWLICFVIKYVMPNLYIKTAIGAFLEILGYDRDITRQEAKKAQGNITFTRVSTSTPLSIPAGTIIRTVAINDVIYRMITDEDAEFEDGSATLDVAATAENEGSAYNLAAGYYSILEAEIPGVLTVANDDNWLITPGDDVESDDDFRKRMQNQFSAVGDWHVDSKYRAMITNLTGIANDRIYFDKDIPRGPGSVDAYILFDVDTPSQTYIDAINKYIRDDGNHGHGDDMLAKPLPEKTFDISATAYFPDNIDAENRAWQLQHLEYFIRCAFRENSGWTDHVTQTYPWARFSFSTLDKELHSYFPDLISITWSCQDIISEFWIPRLGTLTIIDGTGGSDED